MFVLIKKKLIINAIIFYLHKCALEILFKLCKSMKTAVTREKEITPFYVATYDANRFGMVLYIYKLSLIHIVKLSDTIVMLITE